MSLRLWPVNWHLKLTHHMGVITGQIIDRGLHDELNDGHYILVDAANGRVHHIALDPKQALR